MRTIFIICGLILLGAIVWTGVNLRSPRHYGGEFSGAPQVSLDDVLAKPNDFLGKVIRLEGVVKDQCAATGCYFYFLSGEKRLKIELGDVVSTLPRKNGSRATVEGQLAALGDGYEFIGTGVEFH